MAQDFKCRNSRCIPCLLSERGVDNNDITLWKHCIKFLLKLRSNRILQFRIHPNSVKIQKITVKRMRILMSSSSATDTTLLPVTSATVKPAAAAALRSMWSEPMPAVKSSSNDIGGVKWSRYEDMQIRNIVTRMGSFFVISDNVLMTL
ncbi:hypothetical protein CR513_44052, partial [Mucuna pruriens]